MYEVYDPYYKDIEGFPQYEINGLGRIRNVFTGHELRQFEVRNGYMAVNLRALNGQHVRSVSVLVAKAYLEPPESEHLNAVWHLDRNRKNNFYQNLEWRPRWWVIKAWRGDYDADLYL